MATNHGLYTDCDWNVPVTFRDTSGAVVNLSGAEYVADVYRDGVAVFAFRSLGSAADEGTIDLTNATTGVLTFRATPTEHAGLASGLYRFHLKRDLANDVWAAEAMLLIGDPGDVETYLKFDRTSGAFVELPIIVGGISDGIATFDAGFANTDYTGIPSWDLGNTDPGLTLGGSS